MRLRGKTVLITGGARRLGRAMAIRFAKEGSRVLIHYRDSAQEAEELAKAISSKNRTCRAYRADLTQLSEIRQLARGIQNDFGSIDILVNNASVFSPTPLFKIGEKEWDEIFSVNLKAPFFLSQAFGRAMKRKGRGRIIQIADWIAFRPLKGFLPYSVSKAALVALTRGLAKELGPEVLVTAVCPGPVLAPPGLTKKQRMRIAKSTLVGRWGNVGDVVEMVVMLAKQDFVSGSYHLVDGGAELAG